MKLKDRIQHAWNAFNSKDPVGETVGHTVQGRVLLPTRPIVVMAAPVSRRQSLTV